MIETMGSAQRKILVVDDNQLLRETICDFLNFSGYDVYQAKNGSQAIAVLKKENPSLVITDILMPEKEGISTIMDIQKYHSGTKIIAMSGGGMFNRWDLLRSAKNLGVDATLEKPFDFDDLVVQIKTLLGSSAVDV